MLSFEAAQERIEHNRDIFINETNKSSPDYMEMMKHIWYANLAPGEVLAGSERSRAFPNVIPALMIDALPIFGVNGADAIQVRSNNRIIEIELKTTSINSFSQAIEKDGELYIQRGARKRKIEDCIGASYSNMTRELLPSKSVRTVLTLQDTSFGDYYFDAYELSSVKVMELLDAQMQAGKKTYPTLKINLTSFIKHGKRVKPSSPNFPSYIGLKRWKNKVIIEQLRLTGKIPDDVQ